MEAAAAAALGLKSSNLINVDKSGWHSFGNLRVGRGFNEEKKIDSLVFRASRPNHSLIRFKGYGSKVFCHYSKSEAREPSKFHSLVDEALILKRKSEDVTPYLNGRCIYLVGMMGSGKTTIGKVISEVLGYSFFDCDKLIEQAVGMSSVAQIFKERSEAFFRDTESEVLKDLSTMHKLVIATGGGAVIRPINWKYMKQGITVWLDVPLEALAKRIAAVGTSSRPLLDEESGDPYTKAFKRLTALFKERGEAYANADVKVCLRSLAAKKGDVNIASLTPVEIATETLVAIESFITAEVGAERFSHRQG